MRGDIMFCLHCKRFFYDIHELHDTRKERTFFDMCPHCLGTKSVNASYYIATRYHIHSYPYNEIKRVLQKEEGLEKELRRRWEHVA